MYIDKNIGPGTTEKLSPILKSFNSHNFNNIHPHNMHRQETTDQLGMKQKKE